MINPRGEGGRGGRSGIGVGAFGGLVAHCELVLIARADQRPPRCDSTRWGGGTRDPHNARSMGLVADSAR
ncbi:hypothetical protein JOD54_005458 [Actinokineospora baliensis]|nr:hypothetical protein [Actinokineospora baliensis]